jgi:hypothetical protein
VLSLFIPHRNVTAEPVALNSASAADAVRIQELNADARDDRIVIRLEADRAAPPILLYRSTSPILSGDDVVQASLIATIGEGKLRYTDFPLAGVEYYYAAIDARLAEAGRYRFEEGRNSLAEPVQLAITNTAGRTPPTFAAHELGRSRSTPLPFLQVNRSIVSGAPLSPSQAEERQATELDPETHKRIDTLLNSFPEASVPHLKPTLLPEEERSPRGSDAQTLKTIVTGPFAEEEWDAAEKRLGQLLSTRISEAVRRRAHFYLAQCYFYQQDYTAAFFEFVLLEDTMYDRVQPWLYRIIELR